jgi:hypothetical protein
MPPIREETLIKPRMLFTIMREINGGIIMNPNATSGPTTNTAIAIVAPINRKSNKSRKQHSFLM